MKAVRIYEYGSFEQLKYDENVPVPEINENQLLVKVYATTVNHLDIKKASGDMKNKMPMTFPWIPGHDFSGIVEKTGNNVSGLKVGDKVYGNCQGGSYAEYLAADIQKVVKQPENLSFIEAASIPHVGETAWQAVHQHGQLKKGQKILVHGAAGGVGAFAVQFAREIGAEVYATAGERDIQYVKSLGSDKVINYKTTDFTTAFQDLDLILVLVGGNTEERSYSILKEGGRLVSTVGISHEDLAKEKNITAIGMVIEQSAKDLEKISKLVDEGKIQTDIALVLPLSDTVKGWKTLLGDSSVTRIGHGKIVLEIAK